MSTHNSRPLVGASWGAVALSVALLTACSASSVGNPAGGQPAAAESAPSAPVPPDCPNPDGGACLGALAAGEYQTRVFQPQITYAVPEGWMNYEDLPGNFWLFLEDDLAVQTTPRGGSYLGIFTNIHAAAIDCREDWQAGVGNSPADLVAWFRSVPGLTVSEPVEVTVGGLAGLQIDLALEPGGGTCVFEDVGGTPLIMGDGVSHLHHGIGGEMDVRLVFLERGSGNVTLEITNVREQHSAEEFRSALQPIIDSLEFAVSR
ncbi:hypothetical protein [Microbacterium sp. 2FI]|uniref:hypothetical protein n=1 Tax=Microbacterium sp. 2FI TaxID=2502193 RepID=UPI0010F8CED6|nr:hypothetical protein [Microbacterium sp. 2FI]